MNTAAADHACRPLPALVLLVAAIAAVLAVHVLGPSDINDNEQPRTLSYTDDIIQQGNWALPYDGDGIPATKPVLYNWVAAPFVMAFGSYEPVMKMPSILGGLASVLLVMWLAYRLTPTDDEDGTAARTSASSVASRRRWAMAAVAGLFWLACTNGFKLFYLGRTDALLVPALTLAWLGATMALADARGRAYGAMLLLWLGAAAAALDKGTLVILALGYPLLAARLIHGRWRAVHRTGWWWGLPLMLALFAGLWVVPAYLQHPHFFVQYMIERNIVHRAAGKAGPLSILTDCWKGTFYTLTRTFPWSILAVVALVYIRPRQWFKHPLAPAVLWLLWVLAFFVVIPARRADHIAPVSPAVAVLAAYAALVSLGRWRLKATQAAVAACVVVALLAVYKLTWSSAARYHTGDRIKAFVARVRPIVDDAPVAFIDVRARTVPVATLLGRTRAAPDATTAQLQVARFVIRPWLAGAGPQALVVSAPLPRLRLQGNDHLALYRATATTLAEQDRAPR